VERHNKSGRGGSGFLGVGHDIASAFLTLEASALLHVVGVGFFVRFMKCPDQARLAVCMGFRRDRTWPVSACCRKRLQSTRARCRRLRRAQAAKDRNTEIRFVNLQLSPSLALNLRLDRRRRVVWLKFISNVPNARQQRRGSVPYLLIVR
jgi:hypothetical protein